MICVVSPVVKILVWTNVALFAGLTLLARTDLYYLVYEWGGLSREGLKHGFLWQLVTYQFLHGGFAHVAFNMYALYMFGPILERDLGSARFSWLYFSSGLLGGLGFVLIDPVTPCIGASGALFGVLAAFATLYPRVSISLLFPPVTLPAWQMVLIMAGLDFLYLVTGVQGGIAYAAHVAGAVTGFVMVSVWYGLRPAWFHRMTPPAPPAAPPPPPTLRYDAPKKGVPRAGEVDRVLDKLSAEGWQSLSAADRDVLERASKHARNPHE